MWGSKLSAFFFSGDIGSEVLFGGGLDRNFKKRVFFFPNVFACTMKKNINFPEKIACAAPYFLGKKNSPMQLVTMF